MKESWILFFKALSGFLLAVSFLSPALAGSPWLSASEIETEIERNLGHSLPNPADFIPSYKAPRPDSPSLVVGGFAGNTELDREWGDLLGMVLRWKLSFMPTCPFVTGPISEETLRRDLWTPGIPREEAARSLKSLSLAYDRYGIQNVLVSSISITDGSFEIWSSLYRLPEQSVVWTERFSGQKDKIPETLNRIALSVLKILIPDLPQANLDYVEEMTPPSTEVIEEYLSFLRVCKDRSPEDNLAVFEPLWEQNHKLPCLAENYFGIVAEVRTKQKEDYNDFLLKEAESRFRGHSGVLYCAANNANLKESSNATEKVLQVYRRVLAESPGFQMFSIVLAEQLISSANSTEEGLSLGLECIKNFPRLFRSWWTFSYICRQFIQHREQGASQDLLQMDFGLLETLSNLNRLAMEKAIWIHPTSPDAWRAMMYLVFDGYGMGDEYIEAFHKAVEYDPEDVRPYQILTFHMKGLWTYPPYQLDGLKTAIERIPEKVEVYSDLFRGLAYNNKISMNIELLPENYIDTLSLAAERIVNEGKLNDHILKAMEIYTLSGKFEAGVELMKRYVAQSPQEISWAPIDQAVAFGVPDLAMELLARVEDPAQLVKLNPEDALESTSNLVIGKMGRWEEAKSALKTGVMDSEDNLFSMLRYLELGLETDLDPEVKSVCVDYLIHFAPPPLEYEEDPKAITNPIQGNMLSVYYQDYFRAMGQGHLASMEQDHEKALEHYVHASKAAWHIHITSNGLMPSVGPHLARERARLNG